MQTRQLCNGLAMVLATAVSGSASAALLPAHEQFLAADYTADVSVIGQDGGTGFTGNWSQTGGLSADVDFQVRSTGLTYTDLQTAGGALEHFRTSGGPGTKVASHSFSFTPLSISGSNVMYLGFLFDVTSGAEFTLTYNTVSNRNTRFVVGAGGAVSVIGGGSDGSTMNLGTAASGTNMILLRATDKTSGTPNNAFYDDVEVWLNPNLLNLGTAGATGSAIISKFNGNNIDTQPNALTLTSSLSTGQSFRIDEFFVTDDLSTVAIPEPASLALMGLGGLLMLTRSRRA